MRARSRNEVPPMPSAVHWDGPTHTSPEVAGPRSAQLPDSAVDLGVTSFPHAPCLPCHKSLGPNITAWGVKDNGEDLAAEDVSGFSERVTQILEDVWMEKEL